MVVESGRRRLAILNGRRVGSEAWAGLTDFAVVAVKENKKLLNMIFRLIFD